VLDAWRANGVRPTVAIPPGSGRAGGGAGGAGCGGAGWSVAGSTCSGRADDPALATK